MKTIRTFSATVAAIAALTGSAAVAQEFVAKIGHLESAAQNRHLHLEKVAALVNERTDGNVEFVLYPQAQLGDQRQMNEGVQFGSLEATVAPAAFLGGFNPVVSILDIPYLLPEDEAAAQALREGPFGEALLNSFADKGMHAIALWPNGRKHITSNLPVNDLADYANQKFRVMDSRVLIEQFNALDASAIAIPFGELYTALQTGVIDGQENPLDTIETMKYFEVQSNLVISGHGAMEDVVIFSPIWWNTLPEDYQTIIQDAFIEMVPDLVANKQAAVDRALDAVTAAGMNVREAGADERAAFREATFAATSGAYVAQAGAAGQALLDVYLAEYEKLAQ
ncbi:TRAP transporter substrate-binding protein [Roseinatronobacter sp. S2]|uniref:TRAP transporter substrate-binding protein n=1 Tax=Roseinatronobacter sp. S2 TaxID=3035471 RepID=UPI00240F75B5|nr:TRAP transporter substrate-binding protein [Roseinatronobacter sp. S2]WFE74729.1 TRAP transporter substrate-binding protein [Roseinatronobacter sp. S2]